MAYADAIGAGLERARGFVAHAVQGLASSTSMIGLAAGAMLLPGAGQAQELATAEADESNQGEIVVTAQRREERSVDVPITVTTLGEDLLKTANVEELSDIAKLTPGLRFDFSGPFFQPTIRGIGTAVVSSGGGGNVGIYVDGFYSPNPLAANMQLMKVESVQVLKGPQGTLFGRNTTGGAILVQTAEPSTATGGQVKFTYGRFNEASAQAYYTQRLSDSVAVDVEGLYRRGDGWQRNISNGQRVGDYESWSVRTGLKADLSDSISVLLRYQHGEMDDPAAVLSASYFDASVGSGAPFFASPGQFTFEENEVATGTAPADQEFIRSNSDILQGTIKADLGFANLTSYTQYRKEYVDSSIDGDYSGVETYQTGIANDNETFSQELLLTSKPGSRLQWTAGAFYFTNRDTYIIYFDYFPLFGITERTGATRFGSSTTTKSLAGFVDLTYEATPKLFVTVGGRYAHDEVTDAYFIPPFAGQVQTNLDSISENRFTPRAVVRYKPTDRTSVYASYTKGYKAGLIDVGGGGGARVRPEEIEAYEVGFKYASRALSFEGSAFYYDYRDLQVSLFRTVQAQIINAAKSKIYGVDLQLRYDFGDNFQVIAGGAWVHAQYKSFTDAPIYTPCASVPAGCVDNSFIIIPTNLTNVTMQRTPEWTANLGLRYRTELAAGQLQLSSNLYYSSKYFYGPSGIQFPQSAYATLSLRAQWTDPSDRFNVALWGDNVTDTRYRTNVQYGPGGLGATWNKLATFGIELGARF